MKKSKWVVLLLMVMFVFEGCGDFHKRVGRNNAKQKCRYGSGKF